MSKSLNRTAAAFLLAFFVLALALGRWSIASPELVARDDNPRRVFEEQLIQRGSIFDRNGQVLAETVPQSSTLARRYPFLAAAPVVGYYSINYGSAGVEEALDRVLRGPRDALDQLLHHRQSGQGVPTTLDSRAQQMLSDRLRQPGAAIVLSLPDGAITALASNPSFDPNTLAENWKTLSTDPAAPLLNRATQGLYQPGAIFETGGELRLSSAPGDAATIESIRRLSPRDAERWPEFVRFMNAAAGFLDATYGTAMPRLPRVDWRRDGLPLAALALKLRRLGGKDMFRVMRSLSMSAVEFTEEWFESEPLRAAIGALAIHGVTLGSYSAGTGYTLMHNWLNRGGLAHGRSGGVSITDALVAALKASGGELRTSAPVARILVDKQHATGVQLAIGEQIAAKQVLSAADPRHTLLGLVGAPELPPEFVWHTQSVRMRGSVAKVPEWV